MADLVIRGEIVSPRHILDMLDLANWKELMRVRDEHDRERARGI